MLSRLYRVFLVRPVDYIVNLSDVYSYRVTGKLTVFFVVSGVQISESTSGGFFHFLRTTFSSILKSRVSLILAKAVDLRVTLKHRRDSYHL
jgi:hypothetical protein